MGEFNPTGKLPYALAKTSAAVVKQAPDEPGYPEEDTLFPFGFGLNYK
jgi:beta-glucosidase